MAQPPTTTMKIESELYRRVRLRQVAAGLGAAWQWIKRLEDKYGDALAREIEHENPHGEAGRDA